MPQKRPEKSKNPSGKIGNWDNLYFSGDFWGYAVNISDCYILRLCGALYGVFREGVGYLYSPALKRLKTALNAK